MLLKVGSLQHSDCEQSLHDSGEMNILIERVGLLKLLHLHTPIQMYIVGCSNQHSVCSGHKVKLRTLDEIILHWYVHTILGRVKHTTQTPLEKDMYIQTQHIN